MAGVISFKMTGNFDRSTRWLQKLQRAEFYKRVNAIAAQGTSALASATPVDSSKTAQSWSHEVKITRTSCHIEWHNSNVNQGVPIANHPTVWAWYWHRGYVAGRDYINPAIRPIFDKIAEDVWSEVTRSG